MHPVEVLLSPIGRAFRTRRADEAASLSRDPAFETANHFSLSSPHFPDGGEIPAKYCGWLIGQNVSPALAWSGLPAETVDLLLLVEDLDSPRTPPRIHAVAAFAPTEGGLHEGALNPPTTSVRLLPGRRGPRGYAGPRPMPGHGPHHYRFHLYALDRRHDLATTSGGAGLVAAARGHVLASATLLGTRTS